MNRWLRFFAVLCVLGSGLSIALAEVPWKTESYHLEANKQPLDELLRQFGADQGVSIVVSEKVAGTVSGTFTNLTPQKFLDQITSANGLIWYYDGHSIFVYRSDEVATQMFPLRFTTPTKVKESLSTLGITWTTGSLKSLDEDLLIYAIGPPRYLSLVEQTILMLEEVATQRTGGEYETQVFPLRYAWADDQTFFFTDTRVTVPGIATILRNLETQQNTGNQSGSASNTQELPNTLTKLRGQGLIAAGRPPGQTLPGAAINQAGPPPPGGVRDAVGPSVIPAGDATVQDAQAIGTAYIAADTRINAVVVRDLREKMAMYKTVIAELDQPVGLVQISASIIDVDRDYSYEFGPPYDFTLRDNAGDVFQFNMGIIPGETGNFVTTFVKNSAVQFLSRMKALEAAGKANIVSQPSVLTLNNVEANLSATDTFFVRVAGNREVDLFNVSVGVTLRIIPHIVEDDQHGRKVKLIIRVEDGTLKDEQVDSIPVIRRSSINTQAVLNDEESLLIGGLYNEREVQVDRGIPILGRVPKVGFLFRSTETERRRSERLVLITPRVVELNVNQNLPLPLQPPYPIPCMTDVPQPWPNGYPPCLDRAALAPALSNGLYIPPGQQPPVLLDPVDPNACPPGQAPPTANVPPQPGPMKPQLPQLKDPPDLPPNESQRNPPRGASPTLEAVRKQSPHWIAPPPQRNVTVTKTDRPPAPTIQARTAPHQPVARTQIERPKDALPPHLDPVPRKAPVEQARAEARPAVKSQANVVPSEVRAVPVPPQSRVQEQSTPDLERVPRPQPEAVPPVIEVSQGRVMPTKTMPSSRSASSPIYETPSESKRVASAADREAGVAQAALTVPQPQPRELQPRPQVQQARYSQDAAAHAELPLPEPTAGQSLTAIPGSRRLGPAIPPAIPMTFIGKPKVLSAPPACRKL